MTSDRHPHTPAELRGNHEVTLTTTPALRWTCTCGHTKELGLWQTMPDVLNGVYLHLVERIVDGEAHYLDDDLVLRLATPPPGG